ncbi:MAG: hypothetical protein CSA38_02175 [Flavobacteriales bacterium]|nr:MAG: hypothetical protein CSA38_02175 [Flavobacteriales bacterium]
MKFKNQILALSAVATLLVSCNDKKGDTTKNDKTPSNVKFKSLKDSASYAMGLNYSRNVLQFEKTLDVKESINNKEVIKGYNDGVAALKGKSPSYIQGLIAGLQKELMMKQMDTTNVLSNEMVLQGLEDGLNKKEALNDNKALQTYLAPIQQKGQAKMQKRRQARLDILKEKNLKAGNKFIEEKKKDGFQVTESGLMYKVIKKGDDAKKPTDKDLAKVIYTGKHIDGKEFDSSKGEARDMRVSGVVPGFKEALKMMSKGSKMQIILPPALGYGENGNQRIEPNSVLVFDLELTDFAPAPKPKAPKPMQLSPEQIQKMMQKQRGK